MALRVSSSDDVDVKLMLSNDVLSVICASFERRFANGAVVSIDIGSSKLQRRMGNNVIKNLSVEYSARMCSM